MSERNCPEKDVCMNPVVTFVGLCTVFDPLRKLNSTLLNSLKFRAFNFLFKMSP